jgi:hypothetical protein
MERQPNKELKVQNKYKSSSKNFQPGTTDDSNTKVDNNQPCYCQCDVGGSCVDSQRLEVSGLEMLFSVSVG